MPTEDRRAKRPKGSHVCLRTYHAAENPTYLGEHGSHGSRQRPIQGRHHELHRGQGGNCHRSAGGCCFSHASTCVGKVPMNERRWLFTDREDESIPYIPVPAMVSHHCRTRRKNHPRSGREGSPVMGWRVAGRRGKGGGGGRRKKERHGERETWLYTLRCRY